MNNKSINIQEIKPNILFVEDKKNFRESSIKNLKEINCSVLAVDNADEALECYLHSPNIDLVFTDIDLLGRIERDKSGVDIARFIRQLDCDMPIIGYSSKFKSGELGPEEIGLFNSWYDKGKMLPTEINQMFDQVKIIADERKEQRINEMCDIFNLLKDKNVINKSDFNEVLGVAFEFGNAPISQLNQAIEELGFKLILINAQRNENIKKPVLIWLREDDNCCEVEVYGFSDLFGFGKTKDDAINNLLSIMLGFHNDMSIDSEDNFAGPALKLKKFLSNIFNNN